MIKHDLYKSGMKLALRASNQDDTVVSAGNFIVGGGYFSVIAGPCSVEDYNHLYETAVAVKNAGAALFRGGAYKPRTSPYSFQGLGKEGLKYLIEAGKSAGLPVVTEIIDISLLDIYTDIDIIQVGARNMQNYVLLRELGRSTKPVLLKRGISATIDELLFSAEYILSEGNKNVILCERGIRTFDRYTRSTFDISAIPILKQLTHLPVIADPSHAAGNSELVAPISLGAVGAGCDGLMIEVHHDPENARSDGEESLNHNQFTKLMSQIRDIHPYSYQYKE